MKEIGHYVDPAINYEDTAQAWANHLDKPFPSSTNPHEVSLCLDLIRALWRDVSKETLESIELDPDSFSMRVSDYRYNMVMQHLTEY